MALLTVPRKLLSPKPCRILRKESKKRIVKWISKKKKLNPKYLSHSPQQSIWSAETHYNTCRCDLCCNGSWFTVKLAVEFQWRLNCEKNSVFSSAFKTFQECFVFYMQPEVMAEDEVNNVSLCHNDNCVTISNDPCSAPVVVLLFCVLSVCLLRVIDNYFFFCLSVESPSFFF